MGVFVDDVVVSQMCDQGMCQIVQDCDDGNECISDLCTDGDCLHFIIFGCGVECVGDEECMEKFFCTISFCENGQCVIMVEILDCCQFSVECNDSDVCIED